MLLFFLKHNYVEQTGTIVTYMELIRKNKVNLSKKFHLILFTSIHSRNGQ